jgi:phage replication O-like protein O
VGQLADVQLENGYTKIANEILEQTMKLKLSPTQFKIVLAVWRFTYGFNRKDHGMSLSFIANATNSHKQGIKKDIDKLVDRKILLVTEEASYSSTRKLAFNKNYDQWENEQSVKQLTVSQTTDSGVSQTAYSPVSQTAYQEINNLNKKERNDDMIPNPFTEYEKAFQQFPSGMLANDFMYWIEDPKSKFEQPLEIMCEVIKRAKDQEPKNPSKYVSKIIADLHQKELYTFEAVQKHNAAFDAKAKKRANKNSPIDMDAVMKELGINDDDEEEST